MDRKRVSVHAQPHLDTFIGTGAISSRIYVLNSSMTNTSFYMSYLMI